MLLHGLQKMTLLDFPGKVACTVFTGGCNFRCPFCHNATLVTSPRDAENYTEEQILDFLKKRKGLLDGVAVTGGEPLLSPDVVPFLGKIRSLGYAVKLDTNGSFPERLREILDANLVDYVAVDVKNCKEKYAETVGVPGFDLAPVEKTVDLLLSGKVDYEFRTTVVERFHTVEDIVRAAEWIQGAPRYFLQNFIDSGNLIEPGLTGVPKETMLRMRDAARLVIPNTEIRGV